MQRETLNEEVSNVVKTESEVKSRGSGSLKWMPCYTNRRISMKRANDLNLRTAPKRITVSNDRCKLTQWKGPLE